MAYKGVLEDIRKSIALQVPGRVPVFACSEEFDVRMAGSTYSVYNRDAKEMARVQIEAIRKFDYDWAWLQVDDCIEFEVLGVGVKGDGNILPATNDYLPATRASLDRLRLPNPKKDGRMPVLLEAIARIKAEFGDTVCVTGRTAAPFSSATLYYGIEQTMMLMYDDPDLLNDTIRFFTELQTGFGLAQIEAGADAIWFGDCNASGHLISVDNYNEFAAEGAKACATAYRNAGGWSYYHASEHKPEHLKAQAATGVSAVSVGPGLDIAIAKAAIGDRCCILGNVDPIVTLLQGSVDDVEKSTKRIMEIGSRNGGYLFNSGEMVPRDIPEANMKAMIRTARRYGGAVPGI